MSTLIVGENISVRAILIMKLQLWDMYRHIHMRSVNKMGITKIVKVHLQG